MDTQCNAMQLEFQEIGRRKVQADFDGGHLTSDGGAIASAAKPVRQYQGSAGYGSQGTLGNEQQE